MDRLRFFAAGFLCFRGRVMTTTKQRNWKPATQLVHSGTQRSQFGETSEAIYLTQGYVYDTAEAAEARFKGEEPGFIYSRYANPDRRHVRKAHVRAGGRRGRAGDGVGHGRRFGRHPVQPQGRRPYRGGARAVRLVPLGGRDAGAEIRHRNHAGRRHRCPQLGKGGPTEHETVLPRKPDEPDARSDRHRGGG